MNRRAFVTSLGAVLAAPLAGEAQPAGKVWRIGYLGTSSPALEPNLVNAFRQGLRELGHIEGQDIAIEYRWAEGKYDRFPELAAELVRLKVDVILTAGTPGALAAKRATRTIPIVMAVVADALAYQLVASLAQPGGNVTGLSTLARDLQGKQLESLKEIVPRLSRIAVLVNPSNPFNDVLGKALSSCEGHDPRSMGEQEPVSDHEEGVGALPGDRCEDRLEFLGRLYLKDLEL